MKPAFDRDKVTIYQGDCGEILAGLPEKSVNCCVTSPPYWGLRDYGTATWEGGDPECDHKSNRTGGKVMAEEFQKRGEERGYNKGSNFANYGERMTDGSVYRSECKKCGATRIDSQLGLEPTPEEYVSKMVEVFRAVHRVLRDDGTLWLNLGDSYAANRTYQVTDNKHRDVGNDGAMRVPNGMKPKDLVGIPWAVAFALRNDGWYLRSDIIWCLSGGAKVYARTQKGDMPMAVKDLVRLDPKTVELWNGEKWTQCLGWNESPRPDDPLEIELRSGERIGCTPGHVWPTQRGNVRADELQVGDVIESTTLPEPAERFEPGHIDGQVAWMLGLFLAEGSFDSRGRLQFAGHVDQNDERSGRLISIAKNWGGTVNPYESGSSGTIVVNCPPLTAIVNQYIHGDSANIKGLKTRTWKHTNQWLENLLMGYLDGDGSHDEKNDRWRLGFTRNDRLAQDIRTISARLGCVLTLKPSQSYAWGKSWPTYRGEIRFSRSGHHNEKPKAEIVAIGRSRGRRFYDIGVEDEPHLFALASGVLTHNSKPNPMPESTKDRPTKAHEYIFLMSKSRKYHYDWEAIADRAQSEESRTKKMKMPDGWDTGKGGHGTIHREGREKGKANNADMPEKKNKRTVWTVATAPYPKAHFATFPPKLIEPCILAGCPEGGTVLDPFTGSGTTAAVARKNGCRFIGCELNPEYIELIKERFEQRTMF